MTFVEAVEEIVEVAAGVAPIDRSGSLLPGSLKSSDPRRELVEVVEVLGVSALRCTIEK
jgi:hypothetical protein